MSRSNGRWSPWVWAFLGLSILWPATLPASQAVQPAVRAQGSTIVVTGLVVDRELDTPVAARRVLLYRSEEDRGNSRDEESLGPSELQATTDSQGRFRFDGVGRDGKYVARLDNLELLDRRLRLGVRQPFELDTTGESSELLDVGTLVAYVHDPVAVEGLLLDQHTLEPVASRKLQLFRSERDTKTVAEATTDAEGHFRFADVPQPRVYLARLASGETLLATSDGSTAWARLSVVRSAGSGLGVGTLLVDSNDAARWAHVCRGDSRVPPPEHVELLVFELHGQGEWKHLGVGSPRWKPRWKAILCLDSTLKEAGRYGSPLGAPGYRITLKATVVRLADGKRFKTTIRAEPPREGYTSRIEVGNVFAPLEAWLTTLPD
jgi:hypothetical protein